MFRYFRIESRKNNQNYRQTLIAHSYIRDEGSAAEQAVARFLPMPSLKLLFRLANCFDFTRKLICYKTVT